MRKCLTHREANGFSLVEMTVVMSIMTIMVLMAVPIYSSAMDVAEETTAIEDIKAISSAVDTFRMNNGELPKTLVQIGMNNKKDPWGRFYVYKTIESPSDGHGGGHGGGHASMPAINPTYEKNKDGSVSVDFDGDGVVDLVVSDLSAEIIDKVARARKFLDATNTPVNTDYDLYSMGPDGDSAEKLTSPENQDDIIRGRNGDFVDRVERY